MPAVPRVALAPGYDVSRVIKGGWQLAGGHGPVDEASALADMRAFVSAGITTFDCADIYTGVEALIGRYLAAERAGADERIAPRVQVHTKYVPDLDRLPHLTRADVEAVVERSRARLGVPVVDLVQLHWWDYAVPGWLDAARWLADLREAGRLGHLGLTNFDTPRLRAMLDAGVPVVSHQVQYSVLDRRPAGAMTALCASRGVGLLAYGVLAGGFLSERWLGRPAPAEPLDNRSLVKYRLIIEECGGWDYLQALLEALGAIAARHETTIGSVAIRWVLDQPAVAAALVGARDARHLAETLATFTVLLDEDDRARIARVQASAAGPSGEVYELERDRRGRHGVIMRYNLQQAG